MESTDDGMYEIANHVPEKCLRVAQENGVGIINNDSEIEMRNIVVVKHENDAQQPEEGNDYDIYFEWENKMLLWYSLIITELQSHVAIHNTNQIFKKQTSHHSYN